jgi:AraC family transcriptional regulator
MSDPINSTELPHWVPGRVLGAADALGWNGVGMRLYSYSAQDVEVPPMRDYMIVHYLRGKTPLQRRVGDGTFARARCEPGDVTLMTRSQTSHWRWTESVDVGHIYLAQRLVSNVANEMLDREVDEVHLFDVLQVRDPVITALTSGIVQEARQRTLGGSIFVEALGTQLAVHLLRSYAELRFRESSARGRLSPSTARRIVAYIDDQLAETLTLESLAAIARLGIWSFGRHFRATFGCAPHAYVLQRRVERAEKLLTRGDMMIKEVAAVCGFADQAHLTRVFRTRRGVTPTALRSSNNR